MDGACYVKIDELANYLTEIVRTPLSPALFGEWLSDREVMQRLELKPLGLLQFIKREAIKEWASIKKRVAEWGEQEKNKPDFYRAKLAIYSPAFLERIEIKYPYSKRKENEPIGQLLYRDDSKFDPYHSRTVKYAEDLLPHLSDLVFRRSEVEEFEIFLSKKEYLDDLKLTEALEIAKRESDLQKEKEMRIFRNSYQQEEIGTADIAGEEDSQKSIKPKKDELNKLLKKARPEADFFHNIKERKKYRGFDERVLRDAEDQLNTEDPEGDLREETIKAFNQQKEKFKWVKEEHLKDRRIYKMSAKK